MKLIYALGLAVLSSLVLCCHYSYAAEQATLAIGPLTPIYGSNNVTTDITLSSKSQSISAVLVNLSVVNLKLVNETSDNSVFPQQVLAAEDAKNTIKLARARSDKGFTGVAGQVVRLQWKPLVSGLASVSINVPTSSVLTYDSATNILTSEHNASGNVVADTQIVTNQPKLLSRSPSLLSALSLATFCLGLIVIVIGVYGIAKSRIS